MPLIQPPVMKLLDHPRGAADPHEAVAASDAALEKIAFPLVIGIIVNLFFPPVAPLITMLMLGNLFREVLVVEPARQDRGQRPYECDHHRA